MTQREKSTRNPLRKVVRAVRNKLTRHRHEEAAEPVARVAKPAAEEHHARAPRRQGDVGIDTLIDAYSPTQTSLKAPFRADGSDQQNDQEYGRGPEIDRWREEDRMTNKSGDPRIGTHGRTYEPGEDRTREGESEWTRTRP